MSYNNYGKYYVQRPDGRTFCVEPIINKQFIRKTWGDVDPASKTIVGEYHGKNPGGVPEHLSTITEENGFKNIIVLPPGESPNSYIEKQ